MIHQKLFSERELDGAFLLHISNQYRFIYPPPPSHSHSLFICSESWVNRHDDYHHHTFIRFSTIFCMFGRVLSNTHRHRPTRTAIVIVSMSIRLFICLFVVFQSIFFFVLIVSLSLIMPYSFHHRHHDGHMTNVINCFAIAANRYQNPFNRDCQRRVLCGRFLWELVCALASCVVFVVLFFLRYSIPINSYCFVVTNSWHTFRLWFFREKIDFKLNPLHPIHKIIFISYDIAYRSIFTKRYPFVCIQ